jgi:hypothetical protein
MLQVFHLDIVSVLSCCCKSISECCTCCSGYIRMFQVYVPNVLFCFLDICLQLFNLDVTYVFTHMKCFQVFFSKCFIYMFEF